MSNVREVDTDMMVFGVRTAVDSLSSLAAAPGNKKLLAAYIDDLVRTSNELDRIIHAIEAAE